MTADDGRSILEQLEAHGFFQDASVKSIAHDPRAKVARVRVAVAKEGGLRAGERRVRGNYDLEFSGVQPFSASVQPMPEHCMYGIDAEPRRGGALVSFDAPERVEFYAGALVIRALPDVEDNTPGWTSEREFSAELTGAMPDADAWRTSIAAAGHHVSWRLYGGEARPRPRDPTNPQGWYLQRTSRIGETRGGLCFESVTQVASCCRITLMVDNDGSRFLLRAAGAALVEFAVESVQCGNHVFDSDGWSAFLKGSWCRADAS